VVESREASHEPLNIHDVPDLAYFSDSQNFVKVCFVAALSDDVPQDFAPGDLEGALLRVQFSVEPPEVIEGFLQVGDEVVALLGLFEDVVDIDL
jgi:hypothetical protein